MTNRPWATLLSHCAARLPKGTPYAGVYYGRCDLKRGHDGPHVLERGMDEIVFDISVVRARAAPPLSGSDDSDDAAGIAPTRPSTTDHRKGP